MQSRTRLSEEMVCGGGSRRVRGQHQGEIATRCTRVNALVTRSFRERPRDSSPHARAQARDKFIASSSTSRFAAWKPHQWRGSATAHERGDAPHSMRNVATGLSKYQSTRSSETLLPTTALAEEGTTGGSARARYTPGARGESISRRKEAHCESYRARNRPLIQSRRPASRASGGGGDKLRSARGQVFALAVSSMRCAALVAFPRGGSSRVGRITRSASIKRAR